MMATRQIGVKSLITSYGSFGLRAGLLLEDLGEPSSRVCPRGADFATATAAIAPDAPTRFSTKTEVPSVSESPWPTARATRSSAPPADAVAMILIGRSDNDCARLS